ncbi:MAG: hypothetical protein IJV40_03620 [Oscillospiraceae bacterium]|nr:hypothetical protein [Oscillospiraceae bacterium]
MKTWVFLLLVYVAAIEFVCILVLLAIAKLMAREINEGKQIMPVEIRKRGEIQAEPERPEPYWIGPGDPDEDDGR